MPLPLRPVAFVLAASNHGSMIVNRNDHHVDAASRSYGVGFQILDKSSFDESEVNLVLTLLDCRRKHFGNGVVAIDGGANIGVHTIEWARHMHGWGHVLGLEAQEVLYYALAGNVALNNCMNARVKLAALGEQCGELVVPQPDYFMPASFGSLELRRNPDNEFIGQPIAYDAAACNTIPMVNLDSLGIERLDLLKLDVEGMELEVLRGGRSVIAKHRPIMVIEVLKSDRAAIEEFVSGFGYRVFPAGRLNIVAVHATDPTLNQITIKNGEPIVATK
ncbi:FkbM family methyltransferase [Paraburkholderia ginsengisoli]|uniref:FkbM family methyltransferase n=1 Tax=Paraburkholderia ginsengisoli TaxID=311231 RepID=A0A7T4N9T4_9BURK|nr:FkbM family methyltransferase [Paraburkholderia ginsengisoli]QQC67870.1 FkbM family methyltransferase [Paraburkholderia ginsengisoli]